MDTVKIDVARLKAGADYLKALQALGFDPEGLFWARDLREDRFVLILVSSFFDVAGPLHISSTLFKAYRAAATPKEIDPFIVRLHSPNQKIIRDLKRVLNMDDMMVMVREYDEKTGEFGPRHLIQDKADVGWGVPGDITIPLNYIYKLIDGPKTKLNLARRWKGIEERVDRLAA